ncbi:MAG: hypothetical protein A3H97_04015 [Acidobacteria bacterium RIFCSPLOWO2_02_FULL_65_29]|nr:MAG: hypothetical protein A3H97_04015 [Acidobacteria bacterium RIFCSPLOWO2_02_FULL_65_29]
MSQEEPEALVSSNRQDVPPGWRHDMKNQLGVVLGFADLLLNELEPDDPRRADIQEIHRAAARARELLLELDGD